MPERDLDPAFPLHRGGKIEIRPTVRIRDDEGLALAYTPGVGRVSAALAADPTLVDQFTWRSNLVAVVTDGTAVLGLGDLGPAAALPVMEGKALLFKEFGGVDAVPLCLDTRDTDEIVLIVQRLAPSFGGINLEDISAPRCFEIERRLQELLDIPVFHDDQHGTAIVVLAALRNAARVTGRKLADLRVVVSGAGAAGVAVTEMLVGAGVGEIAVADSKGIVHVDRDDLTEVKQRLAANTNRQGRSGTLVDALAGADVFIGVSAGTVPEEAIASMAPDCCVFALANPEPEVHPDHRPQVRQGGGHRPQRLPEPDQQRAGLSRRVQGRPVGRGHPDHRGHDAGGVRGDRRRRRRPARRGPRDPERVRPAGGHLGREGGRRGSPGRRRRAALTGRSGTARPRAARRVG